VAHRHLPCLPVCCYWVPLNSQLILKHCTGLVVLRSRSPAALHQQLRPHATVSSRPSHTYAEQRESSVPGAAQLPCPPPCTHRPVAVWSPPLPRHGHACSLSSRSRHPREVTFQTPGPTSIPLRRFRRRAAPSPRGGGITVRPRDTAGLTVTTRGATGSQTPSQPFLFPQTRQPSLPRDAERVVGL